MFTFLRLCLTIRPSDADVMYDGWNLTFARSFDLEQARAIWSD